MKDPLKVFTQLRAAMLKRQAEIQDELARIEEALGGAPAAPAPVRPRARAEAVEVQDPTPAPTRGRGRPKGSGSGARGPRKRASNSMSLAEAVLTVTRAKPLSKTEILAAVDRLGYKFSAKDPLNSLNTTLYSNKKIKNFGGTFGPK
ncbi:MAG: hypothetical protein KF791_05310 [Verrucomicrobiae bacterium]|nr:hypothetical protein [Verrucomicrobiae bacterium]